MWFKATNKDCTRGSNNIEFVCGITDKQKIDMKETTETVK
jgi:hypothetical protein